MSVVSSPFVEQPDERLDDSTRQVISKLQFQISSSKTEQKLLVESKRELSETYESIIKEKNEEIEKLKLNFDYLYNQRDSANSKLTNSEQISAKTIESLNQTIDGQAKDLSKLERENHDLRSKLSKVTCRREQEHNSLKFLEDENVQLHDRIDELTEINSTLMNDNAQLQDSLNNKATLTYEASLSLRSFNDSLKQKNSFLQQTNNSLQLKIDQLLQNKTSLELLRQKNITLQGKLDNLECLKENFIALEIENLNLKSKFEEYSELLKDTLNQEGTSDNEGVKVFITSFKNLQNNNLILQDKFNRMHIEMGQLSAELNKLRAEKRNELVPKIQSLTEVLKGRQDLIEKLERQKLLNVKEIEFLRELLKSLDRLTPIKQDENIEMKRLEKLVEIHRGEKEALAERLRQLENDVKQSTSVPIVNDTNNDNKRQKRVDVTEDDTIYTSHYKLEQQNITLLSSIKSYENDIKALKTQISQLQQVDSKKQQLKILQLRSNHITKDQIVKQETLDLLRKENQDLLNNLTSESIPRSVFERQENDKQALQIRIDQLTKRITRLREVYSKKSCDVLSIISKFFGYSVEFLPSPINPQDLTSSRIKLVSKYIDSSKEKPYLIVDVHSKSLRANGPAEFKKLCEELVTNWVNGKDQIPCFLGALNLSLYELQHMT